MCLHITLQRFGVEKKKLLTLHRSQNGVTPIRSLTSQGSDAFFSLLWVFHEDMSRFRAFPVFRGVTRELGSLHLCNTWLTTPCADLSCRGSNGFAFVLYTLFGRRCRCFTICRRLHRFPTYVGSEKWKWFLFAPHTFSVYSFNKQSICIDTCGVVLYENAMNPI